MLLVTLFWVSCDGMSILSTRGWGGGVIILLVSLSWVSCDGIASHPRGVVILLVTLSGAPNEKNVAKYLKYHFLLS